MVSIRTFTKDWEVDFGDLPIEAEYGAQMRLDHIPSKIGYDDHLRMYFFCACAAIHVDIAIVQRVRRSGTAPGGHLNTVVAVEARSSGNVTCDMPSPESHR